MPFSRGLRISACFRARGDWLSATFLSLVVVALRDSCTIE